MYMLYVVSRRKEPKIAFLSQITCDPPLLYPGPFEEEEERPGIHCVRRHVIYLTFRGHRLPFISTCTCTCTMYMCSVLPRGLRRQGALRLTNVLPIARYAFNSVRYALALFFRSSSTRCLRRAFDLTTQQLLLY